MTAREIVKNTLEFQNDARVARQMWVLPWATDRYREEFDKIIRDFPMDIGGIDPSYQIAPKTVGNPFEIGEYIDGWGCIFNNINKGVIGEVKEPIIDSNDDDWEDLSRIRFPNEQLSIDIDKINAQCENSEVFITSTACPRPFEQLQFIRGTEQLYIDLMFRPENMTKFIKKMHEFYCEQLNLWAKTKVDALTIMDDWGSQQSLLINPSIWNEIFKPMYKDYIDIAHSNGKKMFMHSDGNILQIIPELIDLGLDALNCQCFCMGLDKLKQYKGEITFWGEMDRQHLLPNGTAEEIEEAVKKQYESFWANGGLIAQCEFGPGAKPENVYRFFETYSKIR